MDIKAQLLEQVAMLERYIKDGSCNDNSRGLCDNVLLDFEESTVYFYWTDVFGSWSQFRDDSNSTFPIEGDWLNYHENDLKHDRRTIWGNLRLSLAKHCLEHTQKVLAELNE